MNKKWKEFVFEAKVKKLSKKQMEIAALSKPKDEIDAGDFIKLRKDKSVEELTECSVCGQMHGPKMAHDADGMVIHQPDQMHDKHDDEGRMAKSQLFRTMNYAKEIHDNLTDEEQLDAWVQSKITKAADYLSAVKHYLQYEKIADAKKEMPVATVPMIAMMEGEYKEKLDLLNEEVDNLLKKKV